MYDIINGIISHSWETSNGLQQYIMYCCAALIPILVVVGVDIVKTVFAQFLRK